MLSVTLARVGLKETAAAPAAPVKYITTGALLVVQVVRLEAWVNQLLDPVRVAR